MLSVRFRVRTIMIVVAAVAALLVALRSLTHPFFDNMEAFAATVVFLAGATVVFLGAVIVFVFRLIANLFAFAADSWRGQTRRRQFANGQSSIRETRTGSKR
jgi:hypothetical protein